MLRRATALFAAWRLLAALGLLLAAAPAWAQPTAGPAGPFVFSRAGRQQARLKFFTQRNLIIVSAKLNGVGPLNFLLDTGVATSLLTDPAVADSLHLHHGTDYKVMGVGGSDSGIRAYEADSVAVTMADAGVLAPHLSWLVLSSDVLDLSGYVGMRIHGLLGADFFRSFVVTIRPEQFELVLHNPATYRAPRGKHWATLPLRFEQGKPYVTAQVKQLATGAEALPLQLVLDTGAGHALSLETNADRRLHLPATCLRTDLGRGLSGIVSGALGRVAAVQLGQYQLPQVLTSFPDSSQVHQRLSTRERALRQGNLGYEVLKRFTCVIDYSRHQLLLRPTAALREPFEHDMSGIDLMAIGQDYRRYLVQRVLPGSPADDAGIQPEEELMSINFTPVTAYSISEVNRMLHSEDGRLLVLVLRRPNGNLHPAAVRLKRRI
ncbi:hypothetical protein HHL22_05640 [Hymenobacter sp. RP-2-7]|uniref:PDZ domain-containing protein n=1 Tax=Hymenobacter polaris TaxID=2682546 RepID=A0A7Y0ACA0_9BACT|nr:aspartyl protease family protein [Hymenobacter polaris]NML64683.1 hypothetical protein [Hymenobacter polaris]